MGNKVKPKVIFINAIRRLKDAEANKNRQAVDELTIFLQQLICTMASSFVQFLHVNKKQTFRPKKKFPAGTMRYNLHKQAQASLHAGLDLKSSVRLPRDENLNDWIAVHVVDFFNRINLLYGTIADNCSAQSCPVMSGGSRYEYLWQDGQQYKKPTRLPAPDYMALLMDWVEGKINDETCFPVDTAVPFPPNFRSVCKKILTRLFRVFVHIYIHHFDRLRHIGAEPHANTCYKHFYYFVTEFGLIDSKELEPLKEMTTKLLGPQNMRGAAAPRTRPTNSRS